MRILREGKPFIYFSIDGVDLKQYEIRIEPSEPQESKSAHWNQAESESMALETFRSETAFESSEDCESEASKSIVASDSQE